ncbi:MAG: hypothetical protein CTY25_01560 [Methylobacterium sp.]|nr:MAG: hypothetical protein CTY25_01560 [Methylobacterium sp.]
MPIFNVAARGRPNAFIYAELSGAVGGKASDDADGIIYDGDGARVFFDGSQGLRFLGCDAPEMAYKVPISPTQSTSSPSDRRAKLGSPEWAAYLTDPLAPGQWPAFPGKGLHPLVAARVAAASGPDAAANHARHAVIARQTLVDLIKADQATIGVGPEGFRFFLAFAHEMVDGYGRPLVYLNASSKDEATRPRLTYNERLIEKGVASPFFIWPNTDPFRGKRSVKDAALPPAALRTLARKGKLGATRAMAEAARNQRLGLYAAADSLRLLAFEIRMLGDRKLPSRWVIDLAAADDDPTLYPPEAYPLIAHPENRLFIPEEYVPLFAENGWRPGLLVRY